MSERNARKMILIASILFLGAMGIGAYLTWFSTRSKMTDPKEIRDVFRSGDGKAQAAAVRMLREAPTQENISLLKEAVATPHNSCLQREAILALANVNPPLAKEVLLDVLFRSPGLTKENRCLAVRVLGSMKGENVKAALMNVMLEKEEFPSIWDACDEVICVLPSHLGSRDLRKLEKIVRGEDKEAARRAICVLGGMPCPAASDILGRASALPDRRLRRYAVTALGAFPDGRARSALQKALRDPDARVRLMAEQAMVEARAPRADEKE